MYPASQAIERDLAFHVCAGALSEGGIVANFATSGDGWDGPGLGSAALKYFFVNETPDVEGEQAEVLRALQTWSQWAAITWAPAGAAAQARSVDVLWASRVHGDGVPFDGPGQVLAHAFLPPPLNAETIAGDMHLDEDETWRIGASPDVFTVALHEAGHALGLQHSSDPSSVMYPYYSRVVSGLAADDIRAIRSLYASLGPSLPDEYEPDDSFGRASLITSGSPQTHSIVPLGDVDTYRFTLMDSAEVVIETSGASGDTRLTLFDQDGREIASDEDSGVGRFARIERSRPVGGPLAAGSYFFAVEESGGDEEIDAYEVSIDVHPVAIPDRFEPDDTPAQAFAMVPGITTIHSIFPVGDADYGVFTLGQPSDVMISTTPTGGFTELWLYDGSGNLLEHTDLAFITRRRWDRDWLEPGTYYVRVGEAGGDGELIRYGIKLDVETLLHGGDDDFEENDTLAEARDLPSPSTRALQWDDDFFRVQVDRLNRDVQIDSVALGGPSEVDLRLLDASGAVLATSSSPGAAERIRLVVPHSGAYFVQVLGPNRGDAYSLGWSVRPTIPNEPPSNDDFDERIPIWFGQTPSDNYAATREPGEPAHAGRLGGHSIWFTWRPPSWGDYEITARAAFDTALAVYTGSRVDALTLVADNASVPGSKSSRVVFHAANGESYQIAVDGAGEAQGFLDVGLATPSPYPPPPVVLSWVSAISKCKAAAEWCKLKASLLLANTGTGPSPPGLVRLYRSDDFRLDSGDWVIGTAAVPSLAPAKPKKVKVKSLVSSLSGRFLLAVVELGGTTQLPIVYGPLP